MNSLSRIKIDQCPIVCVIYTTCCVLTCHIDIIHLPAVIRLHDRLETRWKSLSPPAKTHHFPSHNWTKRATIFFITCKCTTQLVLSYVMSHTSCLLWLMMLGWIKKKSKNRFGHSEKWLLAQVSLAFPHTKQLITWHANGRYLTCRCVCWYNIQSLAASSARARLNSNLGN
jgi:hypothetical protein